MQCWRKANHVIGALLLVLVTVGSLPGCALFGPSDTAPLQHATAEQLTALLQEQAEEVRTIKGLFSAKITGGSCRSANEFKAPCFISVRMPSGYAVSRRWGASCLSSCSSKINLNYVCRPWVVRWSVAHLKRIGSASSPAHFS